MNLKHIITLPKDIILSSKLQILPILFRCFDLKTRNITKLNDYLFLINGFNGQKPIHQDISYNQVLTKIINMNNAETLFPPAYCSRNPYDWRGNICIIIPINNFNFYQSMYIKDLLDIEQKSYILDIFKDLNELDLFSFLYQTNAKLRKEIDSKQLHVNFWTVIKQQLSSDEYNYILNNIINTYEKNVNINDENEFLVFSEKYLLFNISDFLKIELGKNYNYTSYYDLFASLKYEDIIS